LAIIKRFILFQGVIVNDNIVNFLGLYMRATAISIIIAIIGFNQNAIFIAKTSFTSYRIFKIKCV